MELIQKLDLLQKDATKDEIGNTYENKVFILREIKGLENKPNCREAYIITTHY